ncbi:MAG: hypothetical protein ABI647_26985 [Gemmatimonadota bacterium]
MNAVHVHLIVTHLPVLGVGLGTALLGFGLYRKNRVIQQTALSILVLAGLAAGAAYVSGEAAEEVIEETLAVGTPYLERHEEAGVYGLVLAAIAGAMALIVLATGRKGRPLSKGLAALNLVIALLASGTLAWVANLGGQIGHPEIRSGQIAPRDAKEEGEESH